MKRLKKLLALVMAAMLTVVGMPMLGGSAWEANAEGTVSPGFTQIGDSDCEYKIDEGKLTIRPLGNAANGTLPSVDTSPEMAQYSWPWRADETIRRSITSVEIQGSVIAGNTTALMFRDMRSLVTITNLDKLDTKDVLDMSFMFYDCFNLKSLDLSNLNTSKVTDMHDMFNGCKAVESLDLSNFNTSNATNMNSMFCNCEELVSIYVSEFDTTKVSNSTSMFFYCKKLVGGMGTTYIVPGAVTDKTYARVDGGPTSETPGYFTKYDGKIGNCFWLIKKVGEYNTLIIAPIPGTDGKLLDKVPGSNYDYANASNWPWYGKNYQKAEFVAGVVAGKSTAGMFADAYELISVDLKNLDTKNVKDMSNMFSSSFSDSSKLQRVDFSGINTSSVTNMANMFNSCISLEELDLSSFDTSKVTQMNSMFDWCTKLKSVNLSSFDTSNVTAFGYMFKKCEMLTSLDLSSFNIQNATYMGHMFEKCSSLKTIIVGGGWSTNNVVADKSNEMFADCGALVGGAGTAYADANPKDKTYAHIDGGTSNPGYFTKATPKSADFEFSTPSDLTYSGQPKAAVVTPTNGKSGMGAITVKYYDDASCTNLVTPTNVGTYFVGITVAEGDCYQAVSTPITDPTWTFAIAKASQTISAPTMATKTSVSVTLNTQSGKGETKYGYYTEDAVASVTNWQTAASFTDLKADTTYYFFAKYAGNENYNDVVSSATSITTDKHAHTWTCAVGNDNKTITATCSDIDGQHGENKTETLTIQAPTSTDLTYDGNDKKASFVGSPSSFAGGDLPVISYEYKATSDGNYASTTNLKNAGYYKASFTIGNKTAYVEYVVAKAALTASGTSITTKEYDGTTSATATAGNLEGLASGSDVTVESVVATFTDANAGDNKAVTVAYTLTGSDASNYDFTNPTDVKGTITKKQIVCTGTNVAAKEYDGTKAAEVTVGTTTNVLAGDKSNVSITAVATFTDANAGDGKDVKVVYSISGTAADNYSAPVDATLHADITKVQLTVEGSSVEDKKYDGMATATVIVGTVSNIIAADKDKVSVSAVGTFTNVKVASNTNVNVAYSISGDAAKNYIAPVVEQVKGNITKRSVSLTSASATKEHDGTALVDSTVTVGGDGWATGEDATYTVTGSQTDIGTSTNMFTYELSSDTNAANYDISAVYGILTVTEKSSPGGGGGGAATTKSIASATLAEQKYSYTGKAIEVVATVLDAEGKVLTKDVDYKLEYANNVEPGEATVTVVGIGEYENSTKIQLKFTIVKDNTIFASLSKTVYEFTGKAITPAIVVTNADGKTLTKGTDYTLTISNNTSVGTASVVVAGTGEYKGSVALAFTINPKKISISSVKAGKKAAAVKWKKPSATLRKGISGYQISYSTSKTFEEAKTATATKNTTVSKTIKKLKSKKTYYFKMRAYKKVGSETYYSTWSAVKKAKVK